MALAMTSRSIRSIAQLEHKRSNVQDGRRFDLSRRAADIRAMCNLYRLRANQAEVARVFAAQPVPGANFAGDVYPGYPGLLVAHGRVGAMNWGFPVVLKGRQGQRLKPKPVTKARDDKLHTPFWRASFARRRCLIPVSQWAEPEGEPGRMTRTWYGMLGGDIFAIGGSGGPRPTGRRRMPWSWLRAVP